MFWPGSLSLLAKGERGDDSLTNGRGGILSVRFKVVDHGGKREESREEIYSRGDKKKKPASKEKRGNENKIKFGPKFSFSCL